MALPALHFMYSLHDVYSSRDKRSMIDVTQSHNLRAFHMCPAVAACVQLRRQHPAEPRLLPASSTGHAHTAPVQQVRKVTPLMLASRLQRNGLASSSTGHAHTAPVQQVTPLDLASPLQQKALPAVLTLGFT